MSKKSKKKKVQENRPVSSEIVRVFNAKEIGASLKEVAVEITQSDGQNIESRWFHSQNDADVFIWKDQNKKLIKHQVTFLGQVVEWDVFDGLKTGVIIDDESSDKTSGSPLIKFDAELQPQTVWQGIEIMQEMTALKPDDRREIIDCYALIPGIENVFTDATLRSELKVGPLTSLINKIANSLGLFRKSK